MELAVFDSVWKKSNPRFSNFRFTMGKTKSSHFSQLFLILAGINKD